MIADKSCLYICVLKGYYIHVSPIPSTSVRQMEWGTNKRKEEKKANLDLCRNLTQDLRETNVLMWELVYGEAQILLNILLDKQLQ